MKHLPQSHIRLVNVEPEQVQLTIRALERLAENMQAQGYEGGATLVRQFGVALCEQELNRLEETNNGRL